MNSGRPLITFSTKALIRRNGEFLIVRRAYPNPKIWELPGGHLNYGETADQAIWREVGEEVGLTIASARLYDTWNSFLPPQWQITGVLFICDVEAGDVVLSEEHLEYRWIRPGDEDFALLSPVFKDRMIHWDWDDVLNRDIQVSIN